MGLLNRCFGVAVPIILERGGTIVQFIGDALLAVFDAPTPRPGHELRAAQAALSMQKAISELVGDGASTPKFRIGINTGPALIGNIGAAEFRSFNVVGDAVNIASRLETSAEAGTVLIGESTYRAIAEKVVVTPLGPMELKGKEDPVVAFRLDGISVSS
jgi:class 3 adenylate cyclase